MLESTSPAVSWLLEDDNPAIKYRTQTELLGIPPEELRDAYNLIWEQKAIVKMLQKQNENGLWSDKEWGVHTPLRYLTTFAEHGARKDERLDRYVDHTVALLRAAEKENDLAGCASPLTLRALAMLGYADRDAVRELITGYASAQLYDGGFNCKRLLDKRPERKSCYKAALGSLLLYAECKRKDILPDNADKLVNYFLKRDVFYSNDKTKTFMEGKYGWRYVDNFFPVEPMRMGLPLIVSALSVLGAGNQPALAEAWEMLKDKEDGFGRLALEGTLTKQPCSFGKVGQPNKWVTFYALLAKKEVENNA